jgi:GT2 family glycosyltransferase
VTSGHTSARPDVTPVRVTAVVCTYTEERWDFIVDAIESLRRQSRPADELLVVVDYNPLLTKRLRAEIPEVQVVENRHAKGLSGAKNTALDVATGDILAVLDDDATADEAWLETMLAHFAAAEVVAVGSASLPRWESARPTWFAPELDWTVGCSYRGLPETAAEVRNVFGGAMAMRTEAARALGGFDHQLGRGGNAFAGAEETEFCLRLASATPDTRIVYEPATSIRHRVPASRAAWSYVWRRCYGEGRSKATLARLARTGHASGGAGALRTERRYLTHTIPSALWREVRGVRPDAAAAIIGAVAATGTGFVVGKLRPAPSLAS